jgi:hypothetical protein
MGGSQDAECRPLAEKARALVVRLRIPNIERAPSRAVIFGGLKPTQTNAGCAKFCFFAAAHRNLLHAGLAFVTSSGRRDGIGLSGTTCQSGSTARSRPS